MEKSLNNFVTVSLRFAQDDISSHAALVWTCNITAYGDGALTRAGGNGRVGTGRRPVGRYRRVRACGRRVRDTC